MAAALLSLAGAAGPALAQSDCVSPTATGAEMSVARMVEAGGSGELAERLDLLRGLMTHAGRRQADADYVVDRPLALELLGSARGSRATVTWFGHGSLLFHFAGTNLLVDPVLSQRLIDALPVFPRRLAPLPLDVDDLPPIDAILISHADHDHLDLPTLRRLYQRFPTATVLVPRGLKHLARAPGFLRVAELAWFDRIRIGGVIVQAVPAQHASRRGLASAGQCWTGYTLSAGGRRAIITGDTGYGPFYSRLRAVAGRFDVAFVPIGSSGVSAIEAGRHVSPAEAIAIARDLGARRAVAVHWGTFPLSPEPLQEPVFEFLRAGGDEVDPVVMRIGQTISLF